MKVSNLMKIKQSDGKFEDVKISYIKPNGRTEEGYNTTAFGNYSHAEGESSIKASNTITSESTFEEVSQEFFKEEGSFGGTYGIASHSEGKDTIAVQDYSHAEGNSTIAFGKSSHAEGKDTSAIGHAAHSEGYITIAQGDQAHAEGLKTIAAGEYSHAEGFGTIAPESCHGLHVQGMYNKIEEGMDKYAHIVGNGKKPSEDGADELRSNAHTLDWDGNAWFAGNVSVKNNLPLLPVYTGYREITIAKGATEGIGITFPIEMFYYNGKTKSTPLVLFSLTNREDDPSMGKYISAKLLSCEVGENPLTGEERGDAIIEITNSYTTKNLKTAVQWMVIPCLNYSYE